MSQAEWIGESANEFYDGSDYNFEFDGQPLGYGLVTGVNNNIGGDPDLGCCEYQWGCAEEAAGILGGYIEGNYGCGVEYN